MQRRYLDAAVSRIVDVLDDDLECVKAERPSKIIDRDENVQRSTWEDTQGGYI